MEHGTQDDTLVVLVHGFLRGAKDMRFWENALKDTFPHILVPDLPASFGSFQEMLSRLTESIASAHPEKYKHLYIAAHSMGGLLAREYLANVRPENAEKLVCVGTPHAGSLLADIALTIPGAGRIWKPLHALKRSARQTIVSPALPALRIALIVSTNNAALPGRLFFREEADGMVALSSALAPDAECVACTSATHAGMQFDERTASLIRKFFLEGTF